MAHSVFHRDLNTLATVLTARIGEATPRLPAAENLPADSESLIIIYEGTLALIQPALADICEALNDERQCRAQLKEKMKRYKNLNECEALEASFDKSYGDLNIANLTSEGKEKQKKLAKLRTEVEVLLKRERLNTRVAAMAMIPPIAAGAAHHPQTY